MTKIEEQALLGIKKLQEIGIKRKRRYDPSINAVLVLSGPGTYFERLKPGQDEWMRWMDRDRIRAGVAITREVTAARKSNITGKKVNSNSISADDVKTAGPFFVYNGIPVENAIIRKALTSPSSKLPPEKVVIIDHVQEADSVHPIRHTGDQYQSFLQEVVNPTSPLHAIENVALVSHLPHFIRHPFYVTLFNNRLEQLTGRRLQFWAYALRSRPNTEQNYIASELPKLVPYAKRGELTWEPTTLIV